MNGLKDDSRSESLIKKNITPKLSIQEYLVDLLGGLFPGILFILAFMFSLLTPLISFSSFFNESQKSISTILTSFFTAIQQTPSAIWLVLFFLFLLLAYVIGHVFYRRDPKEPDRKGFKRLRKLMRKALINTICAHSFLKKRNAICNKITSIKIRLKLYRNFSNHRVFEQKLNKMLKENYGCTNEDDCEFPYPYYKDYLIKRGLVHLKDLAIWGNTGEFQRSKTFINTLKIRLKYHFPEKYGTITRNEAHVRLASSAWYVSRISFTLGIIGFIIASFSIFLMSNKDINTDLVNIIGRNIASFILPLIVILSSGYLWHNINKFIHYQRLREVFYVLETAFTAFRFEKNKHIIDPPFELKDFSKNKV